MHGEKIKLDSRPERQWPGANPAKVGVSQVPRTNNVNSLSKIINIRKGLALWFNKLN